MAYEKTIWVDDDEPYIEADNLNKIENELETLDTSNTNLLDAINNPTYTTTEGTDLSIDNTRVGKMKFKFYGDTEQDTYNGENLFDKDNPNILNNCVTGSGLTLDTAEGCKTLYIPCKPNLTYTITKVASTRFIVVTTTNTPAIGVATSTRTIDLTGTSITITTGATANYICVFYYYSVTDTLTEQEILNSIYIKIDTPLPNPNYPIEVQTVTGENTITIENEDGTQSQSYELNLGANLELCKIGNYQDYIHNNGGKWFKHKEVKKQVFNGSETWTTRSASTGQLYETSVTGFYSTTSQSLGFCNQYKANINLTNNYEFRILSGTTLALHNDDIGSVANLTTFLASNNMEVYYPLATPIEEEITEPTLLNQLNLLKLGAESYYGTTNIIVTSNNLQPILKVQTLDKIV